MRCESPKRAKYEGQKISAQKRPKSTERAVCQNLQLFPGSEMVPLEKLQTGVMNPVFDESGLVVSNLVELELG
jgi:hypothetical protein